VILEAALYQGCRFAPTGTWPRSGEAVWEAHAPVDDGVYAPIDEEMSHCVRAIPC